MPYQTYRSIHTATSPPPDLRREKKRVIALDKKFFSTKNGDIFLILYFFKTFVEALVVQLNGIVLGMCEPAHEILTHHMCKRDFYINRLFAYCKGGSFNIHSGRGSAISSAKQGKSGSIYNLVKNK